jgi:hypothetical protein
MLFINFISILLFFSDFVNKGPLFNNSGTALTQQHKGATYSFRFRNSETDSNIPHKQHRYNYYYAVPITRSPHLFIHMPLSLSRDEHYGP